MYLVIWNFSFQEDSSPKDQAAMLQSLRQRFKVLAKRFEDEFFLVFFAESEGQAKKMYDDISRYAEEYGIGRIEKDALQIKHLSDIIE
jgi:hypothetical protein